MMIYGSLQVELMGTECNGHLLRIGTPVLDNIVIYTSKPINNDIFIYINLGIIKFLSLLW